jgi:hypothetical protein
LGAGSPQAYEVALGARDPAKLKDWSSKHKGVAVKSFPEVGASEM